MPVAGGYDRVVVPQRNQLLEEGEHRIRVILLGLRVDRRMVRIDADPRFLGSIGGGEASVGRIVPLHRGAGVVTAALGERVHHRFGGLDMRLLDTLVEHVQGFKVAILVEPGEMRVRHAKLLTLVNVGRATMHVQQHRQRLGGMDAVLLRRVIAPAGHDARLVVVVEEQAHPALLRDRILLGGKRTLQLRQIKRGRIPLRAVLAININMLEHEQHVQFACGGVRDLLIALRGDAWRLTNREIAFAAVEHFAVHLLEELVKPRAVGAERERGRVAVGTGGIILDLAARFARKLAVGVDALGNLRDDVHAETVDTTVEPPVHHLVDRLTHLRVLPVEVRLLRGILVEEILAALGVILPCGTAEIRAPTVRFGTRRARLMAGTGGTPPIPVGVRVVLVAARLEPRVLVGSMVDDQIHHDFQTALMRLGKQFIHIVKRAEHRIYALVIRDIVAVVILRGLVDRAQPQHINAQVGEIIQAAGDALDIAEAIAIGVLEATRVNLVHHGVRPPRAGGRPIRADTGGKGRTIEIGHGKLLCCLVFYCWDYRTMHTFSFLLLACRVRGERYSGGVAGGITRLCDWSVTRRTDTSRLIPANEAAEVKPPSSAYTYPPALRAGLPPRMIADAATRGVRGPININQQRLTVREIEPGMITLLQMNHRVAIRPGYLHGHVRRQIHMLHLPLPQPDEQHAFATAETCADAQGNVRRPGVIQQRFLNKYARSIRMGHMTIIPKDLAEDRHVGMSQGVRTVHRTTAEYARQHARPCIRMFAPEHIPVRIDQLTKQQ